MRKKLLKYIYKVKLQVFLVKLQVFISDSNISSDGFLESCFQNPSENSAHTASIHPLWQRRFIRCGHETAPFEPSSHGQGHETAPFEPSSHGPGLDPFMRQHRSSLALNAKDHQSLLARDAPIRAYNLEPYHGGVKPV